MEHEKRHRVIGGRLDHDRVARGKRRGRLERPDGGREVVGDDAGERSERLVYRNLEVVVVSRLRADRHGRSIVVHRNVTRAAVYVRHGIELPHGLLHVRLAGFLGEDLAQLEPSLHHQVGEPAEDDAAFPDRKRRPGLLRGDRAVNRLRDVLRRGGGDRIDHLQRRRVDHVLGFAVGRVGLLTVDDHFHSIISFYFLWASR